MPESKTPKLEEWEEKLQKQKNNKEAIDAIKRLYNPHCDEATAREAWENIVDTIIEEEREKRKELT